jgi:anti-sigma B factor antagonist
MRAPFSQEAAPELLEGPHMHLDIDVARHRGFTVLSPRGDLDVATAERLREAVTDTLVAGDLDVMVDLAEVEFIDSTGLGALVGGRRRALALNGSFALVCADDHLLEVFRVTGLDKVLAIAGSVQEATAGARPRR